MFPFVKILAVMNLYQVRGDNIMFGKPSKQSSTKGDSSRANDGLDSTYSATSFTDQQPYWQGDLQGYYRISTITVEVNDQLMGYINSDTLFAGASVLDVTSPGSDVIICGNWREGEGSEMQTFTCNISQHVRFIRIWRQVGISFYLEEVAVQGVAGKISDMNYEQTESNKVSTPTASFNVSTRAECAATCFNAQQCIAFSFRQGGELNCFLATDGSVTFDSDWVTYTVKDTNEMIMCS